jgi:glycosyltransferase involved in cell wall biosynthesis
MHLFHPDKTNKIKENFTFLHVSGLDEKYKNVKGIVQAFAAISIDFPHAILKIVSDSDPTALQKYIHDNYAQCPIEIVTHKTFEEVAKIYSECDCFVLFSNYETFSCVAVEALASGLPLIATNVGVVQSLNSKSVVKVLPKEVSLLSNAMRQFLQKEIKFSKDDLVHAVRFCSNESVLEQLSMIYKEVLIAQKDV